MRSFSCPVCAHLVVFENSACLNCGTPLGYSREKRTISALDGRVRCANADVANCNWLVDQPGELCGSCALTRTRPADGDADAMLAFARAEAAKRRLVYQLDDFGLTTDGVVFDLLSSAQEPVITGHADGVVTIDLAEIVGTWLPLTYALNAVNRSMGKDDLYPFVLSPTVVEKLEFVHRAVSASA